MNKEDRFQFYKELYFRETERIEKVNSRLALPFAVLLTASALLSFMLNSTSHPQNGIWLYLFWLLFGCASVAYLMGAWFFRLAWFGHTDKLIPTASDIEKYYKKLEDTYSDFDSKDDLVFTAFNDFLFDYFSRFSSENAINNDRRSYNIYRSIVAQTIAVLLALLAAIPFYIDTL